MIVFSKIPKQNDEFDSALVRYTMQRDDYTLDEMFEAFLNFLAACGYSIDPSATVELLTDDELEKLDGDIDIRPPVCESVNGEDK